MNRKTKGSNRDLEGLFAGLEYPLDVAIVDLGLPKLDGLTVIRTLRAKNRGLPVLVLTARGHWQDMVEAFDAGADDYVSKPFCFEEVLARVNVLVRRTGRWTTPEFVCGPISLNSRNKIVRVNGAAVDITTFEYHLLECLMLRAGEVISKADLSERLYHEEHSADSNVIDSLIARLRRKLDPEGAIQPIETASKRKNPAERTGGVAGTIIRPQELEDTPTPPPARAGRRQSSRRCGLCGRVSATSSTRARTGHRRRGCTRAPPVVRSFPWVAVDSGRDAARHPTSADARAPP
jgi:two-component system response regulator PhoP